MTLRMPALCVMCSTTTCRAASSNKRCYEYDAPASSRREWNRPVVWDRWVHDESSDLAERKSIARFVSRHLHPRPNTASRDVLPLLWACVALSCLSCQDVGRHAPTACHLHSNGPICIKDRHSEKRSQDANGQDQQEHDGLTVIERPGGVPRMPP